MNKQSCFSYPAPTCRNCIHDIVNQIIQIQKKAVFNNDCEGCNDPLTRELYNTRPLTFYLCNGEPFTVIVPGTTNTTALFRIEELKGDCCTLRILERLPNGGNVNCTNRTAIINLCCVCGIQCFEPIYCAPCNEGC